MNYFDLLSMHDLAMFSDWLQATNELCVEVYHPHSGGGAGIYFVHTLEDLKTLLVQDTWPEIALTIFRDVQFPLRGIADDQLLQKALQQIPDGELYAIISLDPYPTVRVYQGEGKSHAELRRDFVDKIGDEVAIGLNLLENDAKWFYTHNSEVFRLSLTRNRNSYENYKNHPERYQFLEVLRP
ncbi:MAG: hypothetical protein ABI690_10685 [Chloroflexota bacterium]